MDGQRENRKTVYPLKHSLRVEGIMRKKQNGIKLRAILYLENNKIHGHIQIV